MDRIFTERPYHLPVFAPVPLKHQIIVPSINQVRSPYHLSQLINFKIGIWSPPKSRNGHKGPFAFMIDIQNKSVYWNQSSGEMEYKQSNHVSSCNHKAENPFSHQLVMHPLEVNEDIFLVQYPDEGFLYLLNKDELPGFVNPSITQSIDIHQPLPSDIQLIELRKERILIDQFLCHIHQHSFKSQDRKCIYNKEDMLNFIGLQDINNESIYKKDAYLTEMDCAGLSSRGTTWISLNNITLLQNTEQITCWYQMILSQTFYLIHENWFNMMWFTQRSYSPILMIQKISDIPTIAMIMIILRIVTIIRWKHNVFLNKSKLIPKVILLDHPNEFHFLTFIEEIRHVIHPILCINETTNTLDMDSSTFHTICCEPTFYHFNQVIPLLQQYLSSGFPSWDDVYNTREPHFKPYSIDSFEKCLAKLRPPSKRTKINFSSQQVFDYLVDIIDPLHLRENNHKEVMLENHAIKCFCPCSKAVNMKINISLSSNHMEE